MLLADQSTLIGEAESTAAPTTVAPIMTSLRIVVLPAKQRHEKHHITTTALGRVGLRSNIMEPMFPCSLGVGNGRRDGCGDAALNNREITMRMRIFVAAALIAASVAPASAYVRRPVAAAHYAGGVAHPYAAARVVRGAAVGAAVVGTAAAGAYYGGYAQPYDTGYAQPYNSGYAQPYSSGYVQPYNSGYTQTYSGNGYGTNYNTGYSNTGYYAASPGYSYDNGGYYGGHVLGCGIGNRRC
jgi:hypothetical protein